MTTPTTQREAPAIDLSGLPLYFKEGVENGGYYLATDVIRLVTLARQAAPEAPATSDESKLRALLESEFACYRTSAGLIPWAINALLDNSPYRATPAAATDQPSARQVDERALYDDWWHEGAHPFRDISKRKNCQLNEETAWMVWQAARASLTPTAPADPIIDVAIGIKDALGSVVQVIPANSVMRHADGSYAVFIDAPTAPQAASQQAGAIAWTDKEIAEACVKAGLGILECHALLTTLRAPQAATTASARDDHCSECNGTTWVGRVPCPACNGTGRAPVQAAQPALPASDDQIKSYEPGRWFDARTIDEMQAFYLSRLPAIREAAKELGYAIGLHGSTRRDFDLLAMQWRDGAADKDTLARAIADAACGIRREGAYDWEVKPSGRVATSIPICWTAHDNPDFDNMVSAGHIDLSMIDIAAPGAAQTTDAREGGAK